MYNVIEPNDDFDFSKLSLGQPIGIQGGSYFTKIEYNKNSLYIQTPKSLTKQGIVKSGKKYYCDLMFDKFSEQMINWFEKLEETCQKLLYEKNNVWFENSLEENDVENAFNSVLKVYRSGKFYLLKSNIKNTKTNMPAIKIYDESERPLSLEDITMDSEVISILEIQGIKFTTKNFQIEIEIKQMMALDNTQLFDNCVIKSNRPKQMQINTNLNNTNNTPINTNNTPILNEDDQPNLDVEESQKVDDPSNADVVDVVDVVDEVNNVDDTINIEIEDLDEPNNLEESNDLVNSTNTTNTTNHLVETDKLEDLDIPDLDIEDLDKTEPLDNTLELKEMKMDMNLDNLEKIKLKKPNQVYYELYKEARSKAKLAKKNAILAYLEAKNIKKTFMIENMDESDSDFDEEIEEMSESELEGL